jgi:hypothetical protein
MKEKQNAPANRALMRRFFSLLVGSCLQHYFLNVLTEIEAVIVFTATKTTLG